MLNQALSIAKWINSFQPESINTIDLKLPKHLNDFQSYVNITMEGLPKDHEVLSNNFSRLTKIRDSVSDMKETSRISFRVDNRSESPKTVKFASTSLSKRSGAMKWDRFLKNRKKFNKNELSISHHENTQSNDPSDGAYILINESRHKLVSRNVSRAQTSSMNRTSKLQNPLFNL